MPHHTLARSPFASLQSLESRDIMEEETQVDVAKKNKADRRGYCRKVDGRKARRKTEGGAGQRKRAAGRSDAKDAAMNGRTVGGSGEQAGRQSREVKL